MVGLNKVSSTAIKVIRKSSGKLAENIKLGMKVPNMKGVFNAQQAKNIQARLAPIFGQDFVEIAQKQYGTDILFDVVVRDAKSHKGGKVFGLAVKNSDGKIFSKGAALLDPSAGEIPSLTLKARSEAGGILDLFFNPNKNNLKFWDVKDLSINEQNGKVSILGKIGNMLKARLGWFK